MRLSAAGIQNLEAFLDAIKGDTYPEPPMEPHFSITNEMIDRLLTTYQLPANSKVLDIGCGQGQALERFSGQGLSPIGINLNDVDIQVCRAKGYTVLEMDQSFLDFADAEFDLIWCRHCLEHSIFPYFTLSGFHRVLKPGGYLYVEVPAPDTSCKHQENMNHYSVMGSSMWLQLMTRAGFTLLEQLNIDFTVPAGPDTYWAFILQKLTHLNGSSRAVSEPGHLGANLRPAGATPEAH